MKNNAFAGKNLVESYVATLPVSQRTDPRYFLSDAESLIVIEERETSPEDIEFGSGFLFRADFDASGAHTITLLT
ncbi:MAG: hypothetical protein WCO02_09970 [Bacteroidota bacterium]